MDTQTLHVQTVVERLEKVEGQFSTLARQNRRFKIAGIVALVLVGAVVLTGAATPKSTDYSTSDFRFHSVQVQQLAVVDTDGNRRAWLGVLRERPMLCVTDENGKSRAGLGVDEDGPSLCLFDAKGTPRAGLTAFEKGPMLCLTDENGESRALLVVGKNGPRMGLFDEKGEMLWRAP